MYLWTQQTRALSYNDDWLAGVASSEVGSGGLNLLDYVRNLSYAQGQHGQSRCF